MYFVVKSVSDIVFKYNCLLKTGKNKRRFWEMALISLSVAAFSFVIGLLVKEALGIDI